MAARTPSPAPRRFATIAASVLLFIVAPSTTAQVPIPTRELTAVFAYFDADATLGDFRGRTVSGTGVLMGAAKLTDATGWIEVRVAEITTGNGRRDGHLRERLEVERFPTFRLDVAAVRADSIIGDTTAVTLSGTLRLHGVARDVSVSGRVYWDAGGAHVWSEFPVDIREYGLDQPSTFLGLFKMNPVIVVGVEAIFGLPATVGKPTDHR